MQAEAARRKSPWYETKLYDHMTRGAKLSRTLNVVHGNSGECPRIGQFWSFAMSQQTGLSDI